MLIVFIIVNHVNHINSCNDISSRNEMVDCCMNNWRKLDTRREFRCVTGNPVIPPWLHTWPPQKKVSFENFYRVLTNNTVPKLCAGCYNLLAGLLETIQSPNPPAPIEPQSFSQGLLAMKISLTGDWCWTKVCQESDAACVPDLWTLRCRHVSHSLEDTPGQTFTRPRIDVSN